MALFTMGAGATQDKGTKVVLQNPDDNLSVKVVQAYDSGGLALKNSGGTTALSVTEADGDVYVPIALGIGAADPDAPLDIKSGTGLPQAIFRYDTTYKAGLLTTANGTFRITPDSRTFQVDTGDSQGGNIEFTKSAGTVSGGLTWDTGDQDVTLYSQADLYLGAGGSSSKMIIDNGGNVGVGCTTPDRKLDVEDGTDAPQLRLTQTDATHFADLHTTDNGTLRVTPSSRYFQVDTGDTQGGGVQFTKSGGIVSGSIVWDSGDLDVTISGNKDLTMTAAAAVQVTGATTVDIDAPQIDLNAGTKIRSMGPHIMYDKVTIDIPDRSGTPSTDGSLFHIEGGGTFTDSGTSGSGTAAAWNMMDVEAHTLAATNSSVTTTNATTLYISGAPAAGTNQTLTNAWALWANGAAKLGGDVLIDSATSDKPELTIQNTNADANGPHLNFFHDSSGPGADDEMGEIEFKANNDNGDDDVFVKILATARDITDGAEHGQLAFKYKAGGAVKTVTINDGTYGLTLPNDSTYGNVRAHTHSTYSDRALKTNIQPMASGLEQVKRLQAVSYDWKESGASDVGFIAQNVQDVVPELVTGQPGSLGIDYSKITTVLVEAVKDLAAQVEELKKNK